MKERTEEEKRRRWREYEASLSLITDGENDDGIYI
jgi:hypothetical protein